MKNGVPITAVKMPSDFDLRYGAGQRVDQQEITAAKDCGGCNSRAKSGR